ncbi:MAG: Pyrrolo-quinoline quinone [Verrucomicrobiaceae bacterium]|nr:Pyrrolo-quinoline quinone [Verrucomicrobiaceae bacterium]
MIFHEILRRCAGFCLAAALLTTICMAHAAGWPQFLGPGRDGGWNEAGPWSKGPVIQWRAPVGGGFGGPVVAEGRVFISDAVLNKPAAHERLLCFDAATGKPLWTYAYEVIYEDWAFNPEQAGCPSATPIVEAGRLYSIGGNGQVHCLDAGTGAMIWENDLGKTYKVRSLQCRPSPLIENSLIILVPGANPGACVVALDKASGKEVWKALGEPVINSSPIVLTAAGRRQLIVWTGEAVSSLDPATGTTFWSERLITSGNDGTSTPVTHGDRLLIGGLMMQLSQDKPGAAILWPESKAVTRRVLSNTSTALFRDDFIYSERGTGELVCLEAGTGVERWKTDKLTEPKKGACIHLTPTGDSVFLFTDEGNLIRATLAPEGCHEISRTHLIDPTFPFAGRNRAYALPAFADCCIFVRSDKEVVCARLK